MFIGTTNPGKVAEILCLFVTQDGEKVFGGLSQDCGRFRPFDLGSLDADE